eukprot:TRINITY_DN8070_c0_g1_i1.p1 TRINITY_DN8070_c0_g1~~TRINITY_DN8070_c0_g1_i1.p1  ORF type:complete len:179 (+),score=4.52 TRINITY_DN8070_c0_g1_i1:185-721(+)
MHPLQIQRHLRFKWKIAGYYELNNRYNDKTLDAVQYHSNIYHSMFCFILRVHKGMGPNLNNKNILFGLALCGLPRNASNLLIQLNVRCKSICLISNVVELSYEKPYYFCQSNKISDTLFSSNMHQAIYAMLDIEVKIISDLRDSSETPTIDRKSKKLLSNKDIESTKTMKWLKIVEII